MIVTMLKGLLHNITLLIVLVIINGIISLDLVKKEMNRKIANGILSTIIGIALMINPFELMTGVVFDARSLLVSLTGVFLGWIPTLISTLMLILIRMLNGGVGVFTGILILIQSAILGLIARKYRMEHWSSNKKSRVLELYLFGIIVHLGMILCLFSLPNNLYTIVIPKIVFPVMFLYPIGTVLLGNLIFNQMDHKNSEKRYRSLFKDNAEIIILTEEATGNIIDVNKTATIFYGWTREKMRTMNLKQIVIPTHRYKAGQNYDIEQFKYYKHRLSTDLLKDVKVLSSRIEIDGKNYVYNIIQDVTDIIALEDKLKIQNSFIRGFLKSSPDIIFIKDKEGNYLECSPSLLELVKKDRESVIGHTDNDIYDKEIADLYKESDIKILSELVELQSEDSLFANRTFNTLKAPLYNDMNEVIGVLGISRDITERKKSEIELIRAKKEAEEANLVKSKFLANMSHEIRTPMNGIIGMIDLTLITQLDNEQRENLTIAKSSARSLLLVLNDILEYTRLETGKILIRHEKFNFEEFILNIRKLYEISANKNALKFNVFFDKEIPEFVIGDLVRLRQILSHLVSNAIKFTNVGSINLKVTLEEKTSNQVKIKFTVTDTGIGIPKEQNKKLFEMFSQIDDSLTRETGGTGLGLSISKKLVELMGGELDFISREGLGSSFYFTIKLDFEDKDVNQVNKI